MNPYRALIATATMSVMLSTIAYADENGVSFWLPGLYGSFAATPVEPGWSGAIGYYHASVSAGSGQQFPRGGKIDVGLDARADIAFVGPTYTFETPFIGAQLSLSVMAVVGRSEAEVGAVLTGPNGSTLSGSQSDAVNGIGDLYPTATLKWNDGVNNYLSYLTGGIPVGSYDPNRLANLGIGHGSIDAGGGYTYFNPKTGTEASAVLGFTYNLENGDTDYQNGVDMHIDLAVAQFLNPQFFVGGVGYIYEQITGDSGSGATLGDFKSRVLGIGPQVGYLFPLGDSLQGVLNVKSYWEFEADNRAEGWNVWVMFAISPAAKK